MATVKVPGGPLPAQAKRPATVLRFPKQQSRKRPTRRNKKLAPVLLISGRRIPCQPANCAKHARSTIAKRT